MIRLKFVVSLVLSLFFLNVSAQLVLAQQESVDNTEQLPPRHLSRISTVDVPSEVAGEFAPPLRCDRDGNLYLHSQSFGVSGFRKLSPKGERVASFDANPDSHLKVDLVPSVALGHWDLYTLVFAHEITRYIFVYDSDGRYKSTIKLVPGFAWQPRAFGVFPSGEMLITGSRYVAEEADKKNFRKVPFTGLFKADGTLIRELTLRDDPDLQKLADSGDARLALPDMPGTNLAIDFSQIEVADDGNLYLMRWISPAIIYVVGPSGSLVRSFQVDPGNTQMHPVAMHISGRRLALLFVQSQTREKVMKVLDLEGHEIATYVDSSTKPGESVGTAFACYNSETEQFTFLAATKDHRLQVIFAGAR